jgi:demethylmenaquinone methyltransferase/2-methoxy-6-polyprenyl-1,4-benzoquinol methylase
MTMGVQLPVSRVQRTKQEAKATYDRLSPWYDLLAGSAERKYKEKGLSLLNVTPGEMVLEIGFGTGESIKALAQAAKPSGKIYGIDLSPGMAHVAREKLVKAGFSPEPVLIGGDAARLPFADACFDAIYMSFTLELFDTPEIPVVLRECRRVLDTDGRIVVVAMTKNIESGLPVKIYEWVHENFEKYADCRPIYLKPALEAAGFQITAGAEMSMFGLPVGAMLARK